jgi:peptide/nickel transport system permease protein
MLGTHYTEADYVAMQAELGLNGTFLEQLGRFMYQVFIKFDFGVSFMTRLPVVDELVRRSSKTLVLAFSVIIMELVLGIPLGMAAAKNRGKWVDQLCMTIAIIGVSVPAFWLGLQLIVVFSLKLKWLPSYGITSWSGWILPIFVNSLNGIARMARQSRSSMLDVIRSDYVITGRAKGLPERTLLARYALPNALIPLIQTAGNSFGTSLGGTVIIENIFSIAGIGNYLVAGIGNRDYAVVRGTVIVLSIAFCLVMLLVDIAFAFVDPRIKAQYKTRGKKFGWKRRAARV